MFGVDKEKDEVSEWISVKDRLPDKQDLCVVITDGIHDEFGSFEGFTLICSFWNFDSPKFYYRCMDITKQVTHWILLPKPPNET